MMFTPHTGLVPPGDVKTCALAAARRGLPVLPVVGKEPLKGCGVYDASTDASWIRAWPDSVTGFACTVPEDAVVVDVDPRNGGDVWLAKNAHLIPETMVAATGGGGFHIWFRIPPGQRFPAKLLGEGKKQQGVDFRQHGNYVVMPGSAHASGAPYRWFSQDVVPADCPSFVLSHAYARQERETPDRASADLEASGTLDESALLALSKALSESLQDGSKHDAIRSFAGWLNSRDVPWVDAEAVIEAALQVHPGVRSVAAGVATARWVFRENIRSGYAEARDLLGAEALAACEAAIPNASSSRLAAALDRSKAAAASVAAAKSVEAEAIPDDIDGLRALLGEWVDLSIPVPPECYVVDGMPFQIGAVTGIVAYPGSGKSPLVATLVAAWASDTEWLGRGVKAGRVLVICHEAQTAMIRHIQRACRAVSAPPDAVSFVRSPCGRLTDPRTIHAIRAIAIREGYTHVVIDTYNSGASGVEPNESSFADPLKGLEIDGVNVVVLLHAKKGSGVPAIEDIMGTSAIAGALKGAIGLSRGDPSSDVCTINWIRGGNWFAEEPFRFVDVETPDDARFGLVVERAKPVESKTPAVETTIQLRDRTASILRTVVIPRLVAESMWRPSYAEIEALAGCVDARGSDAMKKELARLRSAGILTITRDSNGVSRVYPSTL